jgi:glycine/D-amino acid oxidase-like deaminating enzyme
MDQSAEFDVAIIGAGISGLTLSLFLQKQGISSVILEKADRVGGKAWSVDCEGAMAELGACYLARDYQEVVALGKEFGVGTRLLTSSDAEPDSLLGRYYKTTIAGRLAQAAVVLANLQRYARRRRKALARFAAKDPAACAALAAPGSEWLRSAGCQGLEALFVLLVDRFGYGPMNAVPALYVLRWMTPSLIISAILRDAKLFDAGFGGLAARIADKTTVRLESPVTQAARAPDGRWVLSTPRGDVVAGKVAVACPPTAPELLDLFDPARRAVLEHDLESTAYGAALVTARNWFDTHQRACMTAGDHRDQLLAARREGPSRSGAAYYVGYLYPGAGDRAHVEGVLRQALQARGAELDQVLEVHCPPDYLTRVSREAISAGRYFELEDGQGRNDVWLCNSVLAHENWRDLIALSRKTADQIGRV